MRQGGCVDVEVLAVILGATYTDSLLLWVEGDWSLMDWSCNDWSCTGVYFLLHSGPNCLHDWVGSRGKVL